MFCSVCRTIRRLPYGINNNYVKCITASYKSDISLDRLYPDSINDPLANVEFKAEPGTFTGYIPIDKLKLQYSRSSGAGGQNVQKVNTKVEVKFNVDQATWIPNWAKSNLKEKEQGRITKDSMMIVRSEKTRSRILNQADCLDKIRHMVFQACVKPEQPTEAEIQKQQLVKERTRKENLNEKRRRSLIKSRRRGDM